MKSWLALIITALGLLLAGCASTIQSDVLTFHEWPAEMQDRRFAFEAPPPQYNPLEYHSYANLLRAELKRLGFTEIGDAKTARLKAALNYSTNVHDVQVEQALPSHPYWYGSPFYSPFMHPGWPRFGQLSPYYDPFWYGPPMVHYQTSTYQVYQHQLRLTLTQSSDGKLLYDVTVNSESLKAPLATAMPYMVHSAFQEFPGKSGVHRKIEMKLAD